MDWRSPLAALNIHSEDRHMEKVEILRYWRAIENFNAPEAPDMVERTSRYGQYFLSVNVDKPDLPWSANSPLLDISFPSGRELTHAVYAHLYESREVQSRLETYFGPDVSFKSLQHRVSGLFFLLFTKHGEIVVDSLDLSAEIWALGKMIAGEDCSSGFEQARMVVSGWANNNLKGIVTCEDLSKLSAFILTYLGVEDVFDPELVRTHRFLSTPRLIKGSYTPASYLNGYLRTDLLKAQIDAISGSISNPLNDYLTQLGDDQRLDLKHANGMHEAQKLLATSRYSLGCWPTYKYRSPDKSQQLASNAINSRLSCGSGLVGVSCPKSADSAVVLKDLVAAVVTRRADVLATFAHASDAFIKDGLISEYVAGEEYGVHSVNPKLFGHEIVVTGPSNESVRKALASLSGKNKVEESWLSDFDYFSDQMQNLNREPSWGMISAMIGNSQMRSEFNVRLWLGERLPKGTINTDGIRDWLKKETEIYRSRMDRHQIWQDAIAEYQAAKQTESKLGAEVQKLEIDLRQLQQEEPRLIADYPAIEFESPLHGITDDSNTAESALIKEWRKSRAAVFLCALKLHKTLFSLESKRFLRNLNFACAGLIASQFNYEPSKAAKSAWATLFMVIPVLGCTLSSFSRQFGSLEQSDIGWLVINKAGKAKPPTVVGALSRSLRAITLGGHIEGDWRSDSTLNDFIRNKLNVDDYWSPVNQSAQSLADQASQLGKWIDTESGPRWAGLPLTEQAGVHLQTRKRLEFSLKSGWIDVYGETSKKWTECEDAALTCLLKQLIERDKVEVKNIVVVTLDSAENANVKHLLPRRMKVCTLSEYRNMDSSIVIVALRGRFISLKRGIWIEPSPDLIYKSALSSDKERVYVIGDKVEAQASPFLNVLASILEPIKVPGFKCKSKKPRALILSSQPAAEAANRSVFNISAPVFATENHRITLDTAIKQPTEPSVPVHRIELNQSAPAPAAAGARLEVAYSAKGAVQST
jgi:hypothetical protein